MCTALAPRIGYDAAAAVAKKAFAEGQTVRQIALKLSKLGVDEVQALLGLDDAAALALREQGVPSAQEIEEMLDPHAQTIRGTGVGRAGGG